MKKLKLIKIVLLIMFISCSKSKENEVATDQIEVFENKTNSPLASVQIDFYRCSNYDNLFGCQATQIFATGITDNKGIYLFKPGELNKADEGIILHKVNYWNTGGGVGKVYMKPEAWIDLHLIRQNNYPDTSLFRYRVQGESERGDLVSFSAPMDTIIKVIAFGNEANTLNWQVIVKDRTCYQFCPIDTLGNGVLTQTLDKFGTISLTLSY
jgi:hypothetical protein